MERIAYYKYIHTGLKAIEENIDKSLDKPVTELNFRGFWSKDDQESPGSLTKGIHSPGSWGAAKDLQDRGQEKRLVDACIVFLFSAAQTLPTAQRGSCDWERVIWNFELQDIKCVSKISFPN